jgi:multiple sugar transport system substrate-binding protein
MNRTLKFFFLLAVISLSLGLIGVVSAQDEPITITYWTHNHAASIPVNQAIIDQFMADHPNVTIEFDSAPHSNYEQKVLTAFAGGQGPDLFWAGDWMMPQFLANSMIAPVDPTAFGVETQDEFEALYEPGALDAFKFDGQIYTGGVSEYNTFSLLYNVDHFTEAGIEPLPADEPVTWERLGEIAAQLAQTENGAVTRVGLEWDFRTPIWTVLVLEPMVRQLGGELINPETGQPQFDSPEVTQVMEYVQSLRTSGAADPAFLTDMLEDFANGRASIIIGGPWAVAPLDGMNPDLNWAAAPMAQFENAQDRVTTLYAWAWFVNANSTPEKQRVAWELVNALTQEQQMWWDEVGYVQARIGTTDDGQDLTEYRAGGDERLSVIFNDYPFGQAQFRSTAYFEVSDILTRALTRVLAGEDIATVLNEAQIAANFTLGY